MVILTDRGVQQLFALASRNNMRRCGRRKFDAFVKCLFTFFISLVWRSNSIHEPESVDGFEACNRIT